MTGYRTSLTLVFIPMIVPRNRAISSEIVTDGISSLKDASILPAIMPRLEINACLIASADGNRYGFTSLFSVT